MRRILSLLTFAVSLLCCSRAYALEGDWETGAQVGAIILPKRDIYGAGAEFFARYTVIHGLSVSLGAGAYGAQQSELKYPLGLYTLRAGVVYTLDILEWVPGAGIHLSSLFSEDKHAVWHDDGKGLGIDLDIYVEYRGIRQLGLGIFLGYRLVFAGPDYVTTGVSVSWHSGLF